MASRRTRIKGIANIPQRRRGAAGSDSIKEEKDEITSSTTVNDIKSEEAIKSEVPIKNEVKTEPKEQMKPDFSLEPDERIKSYLENNGITLLHSIEKQHNNIDKDEKIEPTSTSQQSETEQLILNEKSETEQLILNEKSETEQLILNGIHEDTVENTEDVPKDFKNSEGTEETIQAKPARRKFLKPSISSIVLNRKPKENAEKKVLKDQSEKKIIVLDQVVIPAPTPNEQTGTDQISSPVKSPATFTLPVTTTSAKGTEFTLEETSFSVPRETPSPAKAKVAIDFSGQISDTEYPPPPPSPSKINRSRIKAIPRLSQRKTSFSASESEDESRRHGRIRNDSVCSISSTVQDAPPSLSDCMSPQKPQTPHSIPQKRVNRTEQSRKIAEARREFQRKFGAKNPDKCKLRMIDLIFYNPRSNPMNKGKGDGEKTQDEEEIIEEKAEEEEEKEEEAKKKDSDEENEMPVPQIKIGASGEIILDEQSLVVESQEVKQQKEQIQKSALVNGDFDTGYGVYKKVKRAKDWTQRETLRFYKALNVIGTDFSLMVELFPGRNRRELLMKFKKEERVNRSLIDKAVMEPCRYDYAELKGEVEQEEREFEELRKIKEENVRAIKERRAEETTRKRKAKEESKKKEEKDMMSKLPKIPRRPKPKPLTITSALDDSDADVSDMETQSDSDEEVTISLKPTRSGRIPKATQKYDEIRDETVPINLISCAPAITKGQPKSIYNNSQPCDSALRRASVASNHEQAQNFEPGSVVILSEENAAGDQVYKMYMVTPEKKLTPVDVDSETLSQAVRTRLPGNIHMRHTTLIMDENVTISEDEIETSKTATEPEAMELPGRTLLKNETVDNYKREIVAQDSKILMEL